MEAGAMPRTGAGLSLWRVAVGQGEFPLPHAPANRRQDESGEARLVEGIEGAGPLGPEESRNAVGLATAIGGMLVLAALLSFSRWYVLRRRKRRSIEDSSVKSTHNASYDSLDGSKRTMWRSDRGRQNGASGPLQKSRSISAPAGPRPSREYRRDARVSDRRVSGEYRRPSGEYKREGRHSGEYRRDTRSSSPRSRDTTRGGSTSPGRSGRQASPIRTLTKKALGIASHTTHHTSRAVGHYSSLISKRILGAGDTSDQDSRSNLMALEEQEEEELIIRSTSSIEESKFDHLQWIAMKGGYRFQPEMKKEDATRGLPPTPLTQRRVMRLIVSRRSEIAMMSNLARALGKDDSQYNQYCQGHRADAIELFAKQTEEGAEAHGALGGKWMSGVAAGAVGGVVSAAKLIGSTAPRALLNDIIQNPDAAAFSMAMIMACAFAILGPGLYELLGPPYDGSDSSFYMSMCMTFILFLLEMLYYVLFRAGYWLSFYFYLDGVVTMSLLLECFLFFDPHGFDAWSDWVGFQVAIVMFRSVRVLKIYSLLNHTNQSLKQRLGFSRETVIGKLVNTAFRQKVVLMLAGLLTLEGVFSVFGGAVVPSSGMRSRGMDYYDKWVRKYHTETIRNLGLLLSMSAGQLSAEPFRSTLEAFVSEVSCHNMIRFPHTVEPFDLPEDNLAAHWILRQGQREGGEWCHVSTLCPWPGKPVYNMSDEDTSGCRLRYLRIHGRDIFGSGPSRLTWTRDLRSYPSERFIATLNDGFGSSLRRCPQRPNEVRAALAVELDAGTWHDKRSPYDGDPCNIMVLEMRVKANFNALRGLCTVVFLSVLILWANYLLVTMVDKELVRPVVEMVETVRAIALDPMAKMPQGQFEKGNQETKTVGRALFKLSNLLQIAFGEAGSHVIKVNLREGREMTPMVPGQRMNLIFGFCDIRSFTDCTESLEGDVMVFVNTIADYVHKSVAENRGLPNKNIGDAFQLAWSIPNKTNRSNMAERQSAKKLATTTYIGDCALRSFLRIIIETATCPTLLKLTCRPDLQRKIPGYVTRFGFGLHSGWAIQGAIGSMYKIDPSWLSPHVKWSERLESATKYYGVPILMTDAFREHLSPRVQQLCRRVDRIKVPDTPYPIDLYTYDIKEWRIDDAEYQLPEVHENGINFRYGRGPSFFDQFPPCFRKEWRVEFQRGVSNYVAGNWSVAREALLACQVEEPEDVPTQKILDLIIDMGIDGVGGTVEAPQSWKGYRETDQV